MDYYSITWKQLHKKIFSLSEIIKKQKEEYDLIVAIARGGLTISHILSDFLGLPVASFTISSYKDMQQQKLSNISFHVGGDVQKKHILLVDDISDSGKTFLRSIQYLKDLGASNVSTSSVFVKPHTVHFPHFFLEKTDKWIVFPYEAKETIGAVQMIMKKEGKTEEEIREQLKKLHIEEYYINNYLLKTS